MRGAQAHRRTAREFQNDRRAFLARAAAARWLDSADYRPSRHLPGTGRFNPNRSFTPREDAALREHRRRGVISTGDRRVLFADLAKIA
jgi:hypothetical protein